MFNMQDKHEILDKLFDLERRLSEKIDTKVSWKEYWTIFAIQMTLILGVLGIIYAKLEKIDENGQSTKNVVQSIQGKLEPYDIIYKD